MAVFHMSSDGYFVLTFPLSSSVDVYVLDYTGDIYDSHLIRNQGPSRWRGGRIKIGPSDDAQFLALEVHGVVIEGNQLTQLWNDLTLTTSSDSQKFRLATNRNGICYLYVNSPSVKRLRVNDYFGWARYGVKPPISTSTIWNKCDLSTGATLVDVEQLLKNKENEMQEKVKELEAKEKEVSVMRKLVERYEEVESMWEKTAQEKDKQLDMIMERNKEAESIWEKSMEEKEKQLVKLMNALRALLCDV